MKILGLKKYIFAIWVVLITIGFSAVGLTVTAIVNHNNSKQFSTDAWSGSGTESSPYLITSIADMNTLSNNIANGNSYYDTYFKLTTDLDYSSVSNFCPIGAIMSGTSMTKVRSFCGVFDGYGHVVKNLTTKVTSSSASISPASGSTIGFFACLGAWGDADCYPSDNNQNGFFYYNRTATVKNLKIYNFSINSTYSGYNSIGGIAGHARTRAYDVTHSSGTYDSTKNIHYLNFGVKIDQCIVEDLEVVTSGVGYVSGLVGSQVVMDEKDILGMKDSDNNNLSVPEGTRALIISNCMVLKTSISATTTGSLIALISPAYSLLQGNGAYDFSNPNFVFYYHISYCVTDNTTYTTIFGSSSWAYNCITNCNLDTKPNTDYYRPSDPYSYGFYGKYGSDYENEYASQIYYDSNATYGSLDYVEDENGDSVWLVNSYDNWLYLSKFIGEISFGSGNTSLGEVYLVKWSSKYTYDEYTEDGTIVYCPIGETPDIDGANLSFFYMFGEYLYNLTAEPVSGCEFVDWDVDDDSITGNFRTAAIKLTFSSVTGTTKTGNSSYTITAGSKVTITYTNYSKSGAYKTCSFKFRPSGASSDVTVTYTISDTTKYIKKAKVGSSEYSSSSYTANSATTFAVVLADKLWDLDFS